MTHEEVVRELRILKAENLSLKRWGAGVLLLALALCGMAMAQEEKVPEVVRARRFEVVDGDGSVRAVLGCGVLPEDAYTKDTVILRRGEPDPRSSFLVLRDTKGGNMATLVGLPDVISVFQLAEKGEPRFTAYCAPRAGTVVVVNGSSSVEGSPNRSSMIYSSTSSSLCITDKDGKTTFKVPE